MQCARKLGKICVGRTALLLVAMHKATSGACSSTNIMLEVLWQGVLAEPWRSPGCRFKHTMAIVRTSLSSGGGRPLNLAASLRPEVISVTLIMDASVFGQASMFTAVVLFRDIPDSHGEQHNWVPSSPFRPTVDTRESAVAKSGDHHPQHLAHSQNLQGHSAVQAVSRSA